MWVFGLIWCAAFLDLIISGEEKFVIGIVAVLTFLTLFSLRDRS